MKDIFGTSKSLCVYEILKLTHLLYLPLALNWNNQMEPTEIMGYITAVSTGDADEIYRRRGILDHYHELAHGVKICDACNSACNGLTIGEMAILASMMSTKSVIEYDRSGLEAGGPLRLILRVHKDVDIGTRPIIINDNFLSHAYYCLLIALSKRLDAAAETLSTDEFNAIIADINFNGKVAALLMLGLKPETLNGSVHDFSDWVDMLVNVHSNFETMKAEAKAEKEAKEAKEKAETVVDSAAAPES